MATIGSGVVNDYDQCCLTIVNLSTCACVQELVAFSCNAAASLVCSLRSVMQRELTVVKRVTYFLYDQNRTFAEAADVQTMPRLECMATEPIKKGTKQMSFKIQASLFQYFLDTHSLFCESPKSL